MTTTLSQSTAPILGCAISLNRQSSVSTCGYAWMVREIPNQNTPATLPTLTAFYRPSFMDETPSFYLGYVGSSPTAGTATRVRVPAETRHRSRMRRRAPISTRRVRVSPVAPRSRARGRDAALRRRTTEFDSRRDHQDRGSRPVLSLAFQASPRVRHPPRSPCAPSSPCYSRNSTP